MEELIITDEQRKEFLEKKCVELLPPCGKGFQYVITVVDGSMHFGVTALN